MRMFVATTLLLAALLPAPRVRAEAEAPATPATIESLWTDACLWEVGSNAEKVPAARKALIERGDEVLAYLIPEKLDTKDTLVTRALSVVITGIKGSATERLRAALESPAAGVRRNAADLLGQLGDVESAPAIAALLDDPDTRGGALTALGALKAVASVPAIVALLDKTDGVKERERVLAASTLGGIGGEPATTRLVAALSDGRVQVRYAAEAALVKLRAIEALRKVLRSSVATGPRMHALGALRDIGDPAAAPDVLPLLADASPVVRGHAALALKAFARPQDAAPLRAALARETDGFAGFAIRQALDVLEARP